MFARRNVNIHKMGKVFNDWVCTSVKQLFSNDRELARCGLNKNDDVFYELNSAFLFIIINLLTKTDYHRKQNIIDELHNQNIDMLIQSKYIASNEMIDYRRCLSQTYKDNYMIMKKDDWMKELSKDILLRTGGQHGDETAVSQLTFNIRKFYEDSAGLLEQYR